MTKREQGRYTSVDTRLKDRAILYDSDQSKH